MLMSNDELMRQGHMTATHYYMNLRDSLISDDMLKNNPVAYATLLGSMIQAASTDYTGTIIADSLNSLAEAMSILAHRDLPESNHPLMGQTLDGIENALASIATALEERK